MTPQIALDLSLDAIAVLSRAPEGGWWREGTVRLADPDMPERLARLRRVAQRRAGEDFTSILVLPDSQLLYTSLERDDRRPDETIRALLRGRTPYDVADLTWDHVQRGDRLQVAVVALDTLMEAETFAAEYGFRPVAVVANPSDPAFPGIPSFGRTGLAGDLLNGAQLDLRVADGFRAVPAPPLPEEPADAPVPEYVPDDQPTAEAQSVADDGMPSGAEGEGVAADASDLPEEASSGGAEVPSTGDVAPETDAPPRDAPEIAAPVFRHAQPAPPEPAPPAGPEADAPRPAAGTFLSARRGAAPAARTANGDRLARVAPRLTAAPQPTLARGGPAGPLPTSAEIEATGNRTTRYADVGARTASPEPRPVPPSVAAAPLRPDPEPPLTAPPTPEGAPAADPMTALREAARLAETPPAERPPRPTMPPLAPPGSLADRIKRQAAEARAQGGTDRGSTDAPALPGIGREAAAAPRGGARLGLMLTLALLAVLALVGVGAAFLGDDDAVPVAGDPAAARDLLPQARAALAPAPPGSTVAPEAREAETAPEAREAEIAPEAREAEVAPEASGPEVAALLPTPGSVTEGASAPEMITPPEPIARPLLARSLPSSALSEDQLQADVAPGIALPPVPDTAPIAETTPAVFIEQWTADGDFTAPGQTAPPATEGAPEIAVAALDPGLSSPTVPGPPVVAALAETPARQIDPPPPELIESRDAALGLIPATAEGVVAPSGYAIVAGRPDTLPRPRPGGTAEQALAALAEAPGPGEATPALARVDPEAALPDASPAREGDAILRRVRPIERPDAATEALSAEAARLAEEALAEEAALAERAAADTALRRVLPRQRPASVSEAVDAAQQTLRAAQEATEAAAIDAAQQAAAASLANTTAAAAIAADAAVEAAQEQVSALALPRSERPLTRPRSVERDAARIVTQRREQATVASAPARQPATTSADSGRQQIRSAGGNVARAATQRNVLRLNQINLIGVYGRPDARRALVRLSNGRYVKVEVGDRLDRGRVTAIGDDRLQYQRGSRNVVLRLPQV